MNVAAHQLKINSLDKYSCIGVANVPYRGRSSLKKRGKSNTKIWLFLPYTYHLMAIHWFCTWKKKRCKQNIAWVSPAFMLVKCRKEKKHFILFRVIHLKVISTNTFLSTQFQVRYEFKKTWETRDGSCPVGPRVSELKWNHSFFKSFQCSADRCDFDSSICHQHFLTLIV